MNTIKNALEKCRTYVAVQKFGCGHTGIGHGVEDNLLQLLNEAFEELAWLEKREPTLMSDCISAGLPLNVALKYDVQLCRLTNYVRDKTLADCVKQEPVAWDLAEKVRRDLDRQSCPDAYMRIAIESIVKHFPAPPPVQEITEDVDAAMVEMKNIYPPLRRSECERLIRAAKYAAPVERQWVDLTDDEIWEAVKNWNLKERVEGNYSLTRAVIAKFKDKNK